MMDFFDNLKYKKPAIRRA